jgi:hypothetical protein
MKFCWFAGAWLFGFYCQSFGTCGFCILRVVDPWDCIFMCLPEEQSWISLQKLSWVARTLNKLHDKILHHSQFALSFKAKALHYCKEGVLVIRFSFGRFRSWSILRTLSYCLSRFWYVHKGLLWKKWPSFVIFT